MIILKPNHRCYNVLKTFRGASHTVVEARTYAVPDDTSLSVSKAEHPAEPRGYSGVCTTPGMVEGLSWNIR